MDDILGLVVCLAQRTHVCVHVYAPEMTDHNKDGDVIIHCRHTGEDNVT